MSDDSHRSESKTVKTEAAWSPERLYIKYDLSQKYTENEIKHIARYRFAAQFAYGSILDIACGSGYGSAVLSGSGNVVGVDSSEEAIKFARSFNFKPNITYLSKFIQSFTPIRQFDTIVCLETFEHLDSVAGFDLLVDFTRWLKSDGQIILSTPMLRFKDNAPYVTNPYHVNEMERQKFLNQLEYLWKGMKLSYFHQEVEHFKILSSEDTGFLIVLARNI